MTSNFHALLIGIDYYEPNRLWRSLRGAVRDIQLVADYLERSLALSVDQITLLRSPSPEVTDLQIPLEQRPTYANIVAQFQRLIDQGQPGDQVYIHYSGHGGRVATVYPALPNKGQYDEGIVPCDFATSGHYLRDVEIAWLLQQMTDKGLKVTLVLDSCHSGGATRGDAEVRGGDTDENPGSGESSVADRAALEANWNHLVGAKDSFWVPPSNAYVLLAACRPTELAYEYAVSGSERHGALTYWMIDTLKSGTVNLSFQALHDRVLAKVQSRFPGQVPLLMGDGERQVFGSDRQVTPYTAKVLNIDPVQNTVSLNAGMAQGVLRGSRFALYPFGIQNLMNLDQRLAIAEVTQADAVASTAQILSFGEGGLPGLFNLEELELGSPAMLLAAPIELMRTVRLYEKAVGTGDGELPAEMAARQAMALEAVRQRLRLQGQGWVKELENPGEAGYFQVAIAPDGTYEICLGTPIKSLRPALSIEDPEAAQKVVERLIHLTKYQSVQALDNPAAPLLTDALKFELLDESFQPFPDPNHPVVQSGQIIYIRIKNDSPNPLNIAVMDLDVTWGVSQIPLMDIEAAFYALDAKKTIDQIYSFSLPEDRLYDQAQETIKLFATKGPADFRWLTLPSLDNPISAKGITNRGGDDQFSKLMEAIGDESSDSEERTRAGRIPPNPKAEWTAKQIRFTLVAPPLSRGGDSGSSYVEQSSRNVQQIEALESKIQQLAVGQNQLSFQLFTALQNQNVTQKNLLFSPLSIAIALLLILNVSQPGQATQAAMIQLLQLTGLNLYQINQAASSLLRRIQTAPNDLEPSGQLSLANSLWLWDALPTNSPRIKALVNDYAAAVNLLDVDVALSVERINQWIAAATQELIQKVVDAGDLERSSSVLINAIYFKGTWVHQFDPTNTITTSLHRFSTSQSVSLMSQSGQFDYFESPEFQLIRLPYADSVLSMDIILPVQGVAIAQFQTQFTLETWQTWTAQLRSQPGQLTLPKFVIAYRNETLLNILTTLSGTENLALQVAPGALSEPISGIIHQACLEVNEVGSEAAAVTVVLTRGGGGSQFQMFVDRPFICIVHDQESQLILFMGAITEPSLSS